jgi:hypothetical protein
MVEVGDVLEGDGGALAIGQPAHRHPQLGVAEMCVRPGFGPSRVLRQALDRHRAPTPPAVSVHRAARGDRHQPSPQVAAVAQRRVRREGLGPGLLRHVRPVDRAGQRVGEPAHVAPVRVDQLLEGGQAHVASTLRASDV